MVEFSTEHNIFESNQWKEALEKTQVMINDLPPATDDELERKIEFHKYVFTSSPEENFSINGAAFSIFKSVQPILDLASTDKKIVEQVLQDLKKTETTQNH